MECKICSQKTVKNGFQKSGVQRYKCRCCNKQFQESYVYNAKKTKTNNHIVKLTQEGMGIKSIARYLTISPTTVIEKIRKVAAQIKKPKPLLNMAYEIDKLCTFIGNKENNDVDYLFANKSDAMNWARMQLGHNTEKMYNASGKWIGWSNSKGSVYWGHNDWGKGLGSSKFPHLNYKINGVKGHLFLENKITNRGMQKEFINYFKK